MQKEARDECKSQNTKDFSILYNPKLWFMAKQKDSSSKTQNSKLKTGNWKVKTKNYIDEISSSWKIISSSFYLDFFIIFHFSFW